MTNSKVNLPKFIKDECGCSEFEYTPDKDLKLHQENAIRYICEGIHAHEHGLPEWLKNSADAYARSNTLSSNRVIILIFDYGRKDISSSISCIDFVGMTENDIEKYFRHWADPEAASRGEQRVSIQGGHGNGGKCYMVKMFDEYSYVRTVKKGKGCLYGVPAGSIQFGYIPDQERGKNFEIKNLKDEIDIVLTQFQCSFDTLPHAAKTAIDSADGYSNFTGYGPKGYGNKIPTKQLIKSLRDHPQMLRTIQTCKVYIIINGKLELARKSLTLPEIKPIKGSESVREIEIPSKLTDPATNEEVSTTEYGKLHRGVLQLYTSEKSMNRGLKARHRIRYISNTLGDFGYEPVIDLGVQSPYRDHIYGICGLEVLERYKQNIRANLADSPLTRAVQEFIATKVQEYAHEFELKDKRKYNQKTKNAISKMNEALDRWKNRFLSEKARGLWGLGEGITDKDRPHLPSGKVTRMELYITHNKAGKGVCLKPNLTFLDKEGIRIQSKPHRWISEDPNVALVNEDLMLISTFSYGKTEFYAELLDGSVKSNSVPLDLLHIKEIQINPESVELPEGGRQKLDAFCTLDDGSKVNDVMLTWTEDDSSIAKVSTSGFVYGFKPGETSVIAWDDNCEAKNRAMLKVTTGSGRGTGDKHGNGYPHIFISGPFDPDPDTNEYVNLPPDDPPVQHRPEDYNRNIWWINSAAPLASLYLDHDKGYGHESSEWRIYHLERYIDIIVQIILTHSQEDKEPYDVDEWVRRWGFQVSEIQHAMFDDLHKFIENGDLSFSE